MSNKVAVDKVKCSKLPYIFIIIFAILSTIFIILYIIEKKKTCPSIPVPTCPSIPVPTCPSIPVPTCPSIPVPTCAVCQTSNTPPSSTMNINVEIKNKNSYYKDLDYFLTKINDLEFSKELIVYGEKVPIENQTISAIKLFPDDGTRHTLTYLSGFFRNSIGLSRPECTIGSEYKILFYMINYSYLKSIITKDPEKISIFVLYVILIYYFKNFTKVQKGTNRLFNYNPTGKYIEIIRDNINPELYEKNIELKPIDKILEKNNKMYIYEIVDKITEKIDGRDILDVFITELLDKVKRTDTSICTEIFKISNDGLTQLNSANIYVENDIIQIIINMYLVPLLKD